MTQRALKIGSLALGRTTSAWRGVTVFTFHRVSAVPRSELELSPYSVHWMLRRIQRKFRLLSGDEFAQGIVEGRAWRRAALVTIDDAFEDAYSSFLPLLRELAAPAVMFVPTQFLDEPARAPVSYAFDPAKYRPCSWDQLREMAADPLITLGAHSHRHDEAPELSPQELRADCVRHGAIFERERLPPARLYCYPRGKFSTQAAKVLAEFYVAGFAGAPHHRLDGDLVNMAIPRVPLRGSDDGFFGWLKTGGFVTREEALTEGLKASLHRARPVTGQ
ncbi:polysaccharide deacetylase family protein [Algiphilus sp. NNCM1]|nr:polysaccharide deacetylase family protein [Algiphilus acroporae]